MFVLLLVLLCISGASSQQPKAGCSNTPTDPIREAVLTNHNNIRKKIVGDPNGAPTDRVEQDDATFLPGSKNLFMITYDCGLEGLAMTAAADCPSKPKLDYIPAEKSVNHKIERSATKPQNDNEYAEAVKRAVEDWYDSHYEDNLDPKTVIYQNEAMEPFANIIYKNTIAVGCAVQWCDARKRLVTACVYNAKPKVGEALYNPGKPGAKCTTDKQCAKVIKGATCEKADGLCKTDLKDMPTDTTTTTELVTESTTTETESTTTETESTTTETESTTAAADTTTRSSGGLSQNLRDKIEDMHNYYRSMLARGQIRNGKEGKPNCPTAMNMYRMRYDTAMEAEAQAYADSCPESNRAVTSKSGLLTYQISSINIPQNDAFGNALETWWTQILKNGVNNQMKYNEFLEQKPEAPTAFTQMAWAESYKVGCGFSRRTFGTVVACSYNPRGNIYTQFIYRPGSTCASCSGSCQDALCAPPPF